jgi:hypothetical protein
MMNPHMAEDITVLEHYMAHKPAEVGSRAKPYSTISTTSGSPVVYLTVPRRRKGLKSSVDPGRIQMETIEQILSPFAAEVRKLYFDCLHPCFPIMDKKTFLELWQKDKEQVSSTLMCDIYASALLYWRRSNVLCHHPRPDLDFVWNLAVTALQDDFLGPNLSTLYAALLDMIGRPVGAVTGNIVNTGRVATLAQSLGLHRDPTSWKATSHEKNIRIRLWWGVVIHDHWSSIGHGIPPTINPNYYDVPLVKPDMLSDFADSEKDVQSKLSFVHLCKLTQILGQLLPLVYALQMDKEEMWRRLRKIECALDGWSGTLPEYLVPHHSTASMGVNGSSNLWFSYLSIKLLICRLFFKATLKETGQSSEARQYRLSTLRQASCEVIDFIVSLEDAQLQEFWLPYTSYLLVTAATILLRCSVECGDLATKRSCITKLLGFRDWLRRASSEYEWDLADFCLERCAEPIQKFADALQLPPQEVQTGVAGEEVANTRTEETPHTTTDPAIGEPISLLELYLPVDPLDFSWESLWDTPDELWPANFDQSTGDQ